MKKEAEKLMSAKEFAKAIERPYPTVALWLRRNLISEATSVRFGGMRVWQIPESVIETFVPPKIGRPSKPKSFAEGQAEASPAIAAGARAKPAKKAGSKKSKSLKPVQKVRLVKKRSDL
jgi:hypothetical protein